MKLKFLAFTVLVILISGCDEQPQAQSKNTDAVVQQRSDQTVQPQNDQVAQAIPTFSGTNDKVQFEQSDEKISRFMDKLDDPQTSLNERINILCKDWPKVYKTEYMPALIHLKPKEFTEEKLLAELNSATDFYKRGTGIRCK